MEMVGLTTGNKRPVTTHIQNRFPMLSLVRMVISVMLLLSLRMFKRGHSEQIFSNNQHFICGRNGIYSLSLSLYSVPNNFTAVKPTLKIANWPYSSGLFSVWFFFLFLLHPYWTDGTFTFTQVNDLSFQLSALHSTHAIAQSVRNQFHFETY